MASVLPNGLCTAQWPLYCPMASVLPSGLCTAQWPLYCPMASVLPNGLCTAQWPLYCPMASVLPSGLCTAQWPLYCPVASVLPCYEPFVLSCVLPGSVVQCSMGSTADLPVHIKWQAMDDELLGKFWASTPQRQVIRKALPDAMAVGFNSEIKSTSAVRVLHCSPANREQQITGSASYAQAEQEGRCKRYSLILPSSNHRWFEGGKVLPVGHPHCGSAAATAAMLSHRGP
jgi:hypothetical protein